ncbi:hypothetical protein C8J57DRAFT_1435446 [Mycena rebaudengoi]|nr:hypothetical protein C8J57DRAFT_1435446 [Mycena rebaudengoi]
MVALAFAIAMLVSFSVASHTADPVGLHPILLEGLTADEIPSRACSDQHKKVGKILQSSIYDTESVAESRRGIAIMCQFNFFVNANAELLRAKFVAHQGSRELVISAEGSRHNLDFGAMSRQMADIIDKNLLDPALRKWVLLNFSTTTINDKTVSAILFMATLKEYFSYEFSGITCGIPRVTLEGERSDWENILGWLEKLKEYGIETVAYVFSKKGTWIGDALNTMFWKTYLQHLNQGLDSPMELVVEDTPFHRLESNSIPPGYAEVDAKVSDADGLFDCTMDDTVRPVAGWWIFVKKNLDNRY